MKNLETNGKLMANEEILDVQNIVSKTCFSSVAEDANITRQIHLTFVVAGPACQNITGNHHIRGQKKIAFSYSDPADTSIQETLGEN